MATSIEKWKKRYEDGTSGAGDRLVDGYTSATNKLAASTSPNAQKNYEEAMADKKVLARRLTKLKKLSEDDLNKGMLAKGSSAYVAGTGAAVDKAANNVQPFLSEIDRTMSSPEYKGRTRDPVQNVMNRTIPIVKNLSALKEKLG